MTTCENRHHLIDINKQQATDTPGEHYALLFYMCHESLYLLIAKINTAEQVRSEFLPLEKLEMLHYKCVLYQLISDARQIKGYNG